MAALPRAARRGRAPLRPLGRAWRRRGGRSAARRDAPGRAARGVPRGARPPERVGGAAPARRRALARGTRGDVLARRVADRSPRRDACAGRDHGRSRRSMVCSRSPRITPGAPRSSFAWPTSSPGARAISRPRSASASRRATCSRAPARTARHCWPRARWAGSRACGAISLRWRATASAWSPTHRRAGTDSWRCRAWLRSATRELPRRIRRRGDGAAASRDDRARGRQGLSA